MLPPMFKRSEWLRQWNAREVLVVPPQEGSLGRPVWYEKGKDTGRLSISHPNQLVIETTCTISQEKLRDGRLSDKIRVSSAGRKLHFRSDDMQQLQQLSAAIEAAARPPIIRRISRVASDTVASRARSAVKYVAGAAGVGGASVADCREVVASREEATRARVLQEEKQRAATTRLQEATAAEAAAKEDKRKAAKDREREAVARDAATKGRVEQLAKEKAAIEKKQAAVAAEATARAEAQAAGREKARETRAVEAAARERAGLAAKEQTMVQKESTAKQASVTRLPGDQSEREKSA